VRRVPEAMAISPKGAVLRGVPGAVTECSRARAEVRRSISRTYLEAHHQRKPSRDASPRQWRRVPRVGSICSQTPCSQTPCSQTLCSQTLCTQTLSPGIPYWDHSRPCFQHCAQEPKATQQQWNFSEGQRVLRWTGRPRCSQTLCSQTQRAASYETRDTKVLVQLVRSCSPTLCSHKRYVHTNPMKTP